MSAPSTPRSSKGGSPVAWTPEAQNSPSSLNVGEAITPRRKYELLLAQFDDSDGEVAPKKTEPRANTETRHPETVNQPTNQDVVDTSASDSEENVFRPRGRVAGRMMGRNEQIQDTSAPAQEDSEHDMEASQRSTESDEDEVPVSKPTRRLKRRSASPVSASSRQSSPGLFVSPAKSLRSNIAPDSDSEPDDFFEIKNTKFMELLAQKRAEKRATKKAAKKKSQQAEKQTKSSVQEDFIVDDGDDSDGSNDDEAGHRLTQQTKPTRKASKKALEEINRETQRLARNQYLAHQATVKRKVTKFDLFKRFNFRQNDFGEPDEAPRDHSEDEFVMTGALVSSDTEAVQDKDTPASTPPSGTERNSKPREMHQVEKSGLQTLQDVLTGHVDGIRDAKGETSKLPEHEIQIVSALVEPVSTKLTPKKKAVKQVRVVLPKISRIATDDSDDDLVIEKPTAAEILKSIPTNKARESNSMLTLRHLANLNSPGKKNPKNGENITASELFAQLRLKARKQALQEKEERINELRAKGVHIETAEEREKAQLDMENLLERAREDAQLLAKKEKAAAKREGKEQDGDLFDDDESDEEFVEEPEEEEEEEEEEDAELSLSEDEDDDDEEEDAIEATNPLFDQEAEDDHNDESEIELEDLKNLIRPKTPPKSSPVHKQSPVFKKPTIQPRNRKVILDDDDEELAESGNDNEPIASADDPAAAFGFNSFGNGLGLSQVFAGTIGGDAQESFNTNGDSMDIFRELTGSMPQFDNAAVNSRFFPETQEEAVTDKISQTPQVHLGISQFQSALLDKSPSVMSELPEPTQDVGFRTPREQLRKPGPASTMDTVLMPTQETPVPKKRRGLKRKTSIVAVLSDDEDDELQNSGFQDDEEFILNKDAFSALFKGAKKRAEVDAFDKKKSAAKNLVEEQAEESEDEYAGLGGASDDESAGEMDEETMKMIDEGPVEVDEQQLAAFHADKERQADEKQINKLYKDVTTGMLRRKRGGDFDELDDSDDDLAERRRRKQEEFARMRRALLADENVNKLAQNPKQEAFFHAIEDRDEAGGMNFLMQLEEDTVFETQVDDEEDKENQPLDGPPSNLAKRKLPGEFDTDMKNSHPSKRSAPSENRKIFNPVELRQSLSFICDETVVPATQIYSSDQEEEQDDFEIAGSLTVSRTNTNDSLDSMISSRSASLNIVNRLIRRQTSLDDSEISNQGQAMAFAAPGAANSSFKAPSLLRRATGLSTASASSSGSKASSKESNGTSASGNGSGVRFGGSKKSNMHYQAKEAERKKVVEAAEEKKKAHLKSLVSSKGKTILGGIGRKRGTSGFE